MSIFQVFALRKLRFFQNNCSFFCKSVIEVVFYKADVFNKWNEYGEKCYPSEFESDCSCV
jgi:hypothetical protein